MSKQILEQIKHKSVLTEKVVDNVVRYAKSIVAANNAVKTQSMITIIDATLGSGGHSLALLQELTKIADLEINLHVIDLDKSAEKRLQQRLEGAKFLKQVDRKYSYKFHHMNFAEISQLGLEADILIADLGLSHEQYGSSQGFGFNENSSLDMRLNTSLGVTAADLLNALGENELNKMFSEYADIKFSRLLAQEFIKTRKIALFKSVKDVTNLLDKFAVKNNLPSKKLKRQVFQALRISVNQEYQNLKELVKSAAQILKPKGIAQIITFHSGEEKQVVNSLGKLRLKRVELPSPEELKINSRARSAKLYLLEN